jgi:hypothetical protein
MIVDDLPEDEDIQNCDEDEVSGWYPYCRNWSAQSGTRGPRTSGVNKMSELSDNLYILYSMDRTYSSHSLDSKRV